MDQNQVQEEAEALESPVVTPSAMGTVPCLPRHVEARRKILFRVPTHRFIALSQTRLSKANFGYLFHRNLDNDVMVKKKEAKKKMKTCEYRK
ncbi:hypothetical protein F2Q68_00011214 [Brassica cretica]|uniref:Uncharacterized protein n=1 Tax=Brassica cretica TaxID=69181 RepID=A0A8S9L027_BRACR|nr:hypothetical protein F2Q68_00011214 [Brassica cretica]